ncbi:hypothetical protein KSS87_002269 [Heliosperma pusillum]|nr:hypothetical protein KSS87_002269 [Heliosperma pusillum]
MTNRPSQNSKIFDEISDLGTMETGLVMIGDQPPRERNVPNQRLLVEFSDASSPLIKSRKSSDAKLDYSHITVELQTLDGLVKDRTQCAPNGYYFIPVYDKGSFMIKVKGPKGWTWDPDMASVVVDQMGCNGNDDINFRFTGLASIHCSSYTAIQDNTRIIRLQEEVEWWHGGGRHAAMYEGESHGFKSLERLLAKMAREGKGRLAPVTLLWWDPRLAGTPSFSVSGRVLGVVGGDSCLSKEGGPSNVAVELLSSADDLVSSVYTSSKGDYFFKNVTPGRYKLRASHPDMTVGVRGSTEVELGFGNLVLDDIFSVLGYEIRGFVVAQGNPILGVHIYLYSDDVVEVECPQGVGHGPGLKNALCHAVSDADGKFTFKSIPCGVYKLVPFYKGENTVFDVSPASATVSVEHSHVTVPQKFQVTGFSIGGRVVDGNGAGVDGAQLIVDGQERSVTDESGYYKLDQVTSKRYIIEARKKHYKFEILSDLLVLPNMASIPDIKAVSYDVCGIVHMVDASYHAKVGLTHGPENVKPQMKQVDPYGKFCFQVPPGDYRLSAVASTSESSSELMFLPPYTDVSVRSPLLDIEFSQAQVNVHGKVVCKEKCGSSVSITLLSLGAKGSRNTIRLTDESNEFTFPKVFPGKYRIEAKHDTADADLKEDEWCWEQSSIDFDVGMEDVEGLLFTQKGYLVDVISSHDVNARIIHQDGEPVNLKIKPVTLRGEKFLVRGEIQVDSSSVNSHELPESIFVDVLDGDGVVAKLASSPDDVTDVAVYNYSLWANRGQKVTFAPRDSRYWLVDLTSLFLSYRTLVSTRDVVKKFLFYPRQFQIIVAHEGCLAPVPIFTGRLGLYIEGSVSPPISGVSMRIIAAGDSHNAPLKKGELAHETTTGPDGVFLAGPLYDDISYTVEASKPGYHLKAIGPHSFSCQKLGQVSVRIYSKEDAEEPFPSVLLSLSGEDGYRNNSITGVGGLFIFEDLFPGSFYLRPLLKEYAFAPRAQAIELESGETREAVFEATRVAYSAMGVVTLLSGQAKEGITIEARAELEGYYEETTSDSSGFYRLRGLLPDTTYVLKVTKKGAAGIERASPASSIVKVGTADIKGLDFIVFEEPDRSILSCHVEGEKIGDLDTQLWVEVKSANEPSRIVSSFPLPLSHFFWVRDLPKGKHLLQLRSSVPLSAHKFISDTIEVDLEKHTQLHVGPLRYRVEESTHTQVKGFSLRNSNVRIRVDSKERSKETCYKEKDLLITSLLVAYWKKAYYRHPCTPSSETGSASRFSALLRSRLIILAKLSCLFQSNAN